MIKIATPISHLFEDVEFGKKIFKLSNVLEARENNLYDFWSKRHLFHFDIDINLYWNENIKNRINKIIKTIEELEIISFQASKCCQNIKVNKGFFEVSGNVYNKNEMKEISRNNISWLKKKFPNLLISLENNNYFPTSAYDYVTDTDFISDIILENNIFFLLDLSHVIITAHNRNIPYSNYLKSLPLKKILQIHISAPKLSKNNLMLDSHDEPNEEIFVKLVQLIKNYRTIKYVTIEYYKDKKRLLNLINILNDYLE